MELSSKVTGAIVEGHPEPGVEVPITCIFLPYTIETSLQACRACLLTDCRLYSMDQCNLKEMFKQLTGLQLLDDKYPSSLCAECATFLIKCKRFREKSLRVQKTLNVFSNAACPVTCEQIKQVRKVRKLSSNLSVKKNRPNFYDTEIVAEDYEEESPTNLKIEQIHFELPRDCVREIDSYVKSSNSLVKQNPLKNLDTNIYVCDDDEEEEEILTSVKKEKIKTEERVFEANLAKRENMKLFSNSSVKKNPPHNFDTCIYACDDDDDEETPVFINCNEIKTELTSDCKQIFVKENPPDCSDVPYITYTYENYDEKKVTTLSDKLLPIELFSDSDDNDTIKTETNLEQAEVYTSKEIKQKNLKMESKKACDGKKPATKTANKKVKRIYNCKQCDKVLRSKPIYLAHLRSEHHSTQHVCCLCGLSFINKRCVREHKRIKHVIDNLHIPDDGPCCPECSLRFLSEEALQTHLQGPLNDRHIPVTEFCDDLNAEISDSPENEKCLKSEFESDGEDKVNDKKASTKIIKKLETRKRRTRKVPLDSEETVQKRLILKNMIVVKRMTLEEQLEVIEKRNQNNQDKPHKCDICSFGTNLKNLLETHMMRHSKEMGEFSCSLCHFRFKSKRTYQHHRLKHTYMYSCVECPFSTYLYHIASKHVLQFHEKQKYTCEKCGKVYTSINTLFEHKKIKHPSSQHVCCLCGYSFVNEKGMKTHHNAKHLLESIEMPTLADGPSCAECSLRFMNEKALETHMRVSHTTGRGKKMLNSAQCQTPDSTVICEMCGKLVMTRHIKSHLEEHAGKKYPCSICGKEFGNKNGMYYHKKLQHNNRGKTPVKKMEPIQCKVCGKMISTWPGNLIRHMKRAHSGIINRVNCSYCDKRFAFGEDLKQHVDHVHLNKPWFRKQARCVRETVTVSGRSKPARRSRTPQEAVVQETSEMCEGDSSS